MIHLTRSDGTPIDLEIAEIRDVQPVGDGSVVYSKYGAPVRVMQSVSWIVALWKR